MHRTTTAVSLLACLFAVACAEAPTAPGEDWAVQAAKGGNGGGGGDRSLVADVVIGDAGYDAADASVLQSTCSTAETHQWHANFSHSGCLVVRPAGATYELMDDVKLIVTREKGKRGRITHVTLLAQDVIGEAGIAHETDAIPVAVPVVPSSDGFTIHVHATDVEVWRLSGHLDGDRVEMIGTVSIGDIVYR